MSEPGGPASTPAAIGRVAATAPAGRDRPTVVLLRRGVVEKQGIRTRTCPQCGSSPSSGVFIRMLTRVPIWLRVLFIPSFVVFPWGPGVVLLLGALLRKRLRFTTTLCEECARADQRARLWRRLAGLGVVLLPLAAVFIVGSMPLELTVKVPLILTSLVAGVAHAWAAHRGTRGRALSLARVDKVHIGLLASSNWGAVLARERPELLADGDVE